MGKMDLGRTERVEKLCNAVREIVRNDVIPIENEWHKETHEAEDRWMHNKIFGIFGSPKQGLRRRIKDTDYQLLSMPIWLKKWDGRILRQRFSTVLHLTRETWKCLKNMGQRSIRSVG